MDAAPTWSEWVSSRPFSIGLEEEVMLLAPGHGWDLAQQADDVLPRLSAELAEHVSAETQSSVIELAAFPQPDVERAAAQARSLRAKLAQELGPMELEAACAGTHPGAVWTEIAVSGAERYQAVHASMRELARREPTLGLHVHVGVDDPESAIQLHNRLRAHLPLLLALSANSPFWQGRDTGLASARTSIFQAFPRVGIPREFDSYSHYVETVDLLLRCGAFPDPTYLWWDVRPQPRFGTVEVRIMDVQLNVADTRALAALVQSIAHLELEEGYHSSELAGGAEILAENRFLASRDGMEASLIDPVSEKLVPARTAVGHLIDAARPYAEDLGCVEALESVANLARLTGASRQRQALDEHGGMASVARFVAEEFSA